MIAPPETCKLVTIKANAVNCTNAVNLSAAKNLASVARRARFFAALRMTAFRPPQTRVIGPAARVVVTALRMTAFRPPQTAKVLRESAVQASTSPLGKFGRSAILWCGSGCRCKWGGPILAAAAQIG